MATLKTADIIVSVVDSALNEVAESQEVILLPTAYDILIKLLGYQTAMGDRGISKQHLFSHIKHLH